MKCTQARTAALAAGFVVVVAGACFGHAFPDHADPKIGSDVTTSPAQVRIWFDDEIQSGKSVMRVYDESGKEIDKKDCHVDAKDDMLLIVSLPKKLPPGTYKVVWTAVCLDSHVTHGDFKFTLKASG